MNARWLVVVAGALALAGCGGSNGEGTGGGGAASGGSSGSSSGGSGGGDGGHTPTPLGKTFAKVEVDDASGGAARDDVMVTFGEPFAPGDVPKGATVLAKIAGKTIPLQVDAKATHADGSLRHAVLTAKIPHLAKSASLELAATKDPPSGGNAPTPDDVLATSFDATVTATIGGKAWSASARDLLKNAGPKPWLSGPLASEWSLVAPLANGSDNHPHLTARFDVRAYAGSKTIWVSATVENDWAYEDGPQNFTYDAKLATDAATIFEQAGLVHYNHARWRKVFFWGADPQVDVRHDVAYLMETASLPNFDPRVTASEDALAALGTAAAGDGFAPMKIGLATAYMPETGGRGDIGPLPSWAALATISQDPRAKKATYGSGDAAGSWSIHYRDKKTDRPVSLEDHPYMTLLGNPGDACNPQTNTCDNFPDCGGDCDSPYSPDSAHQPSLAYLPYLLTGERYYLEELQFWANWNMLQANPAYRAQEKGLVHWDQIRGQGWSMRTLGQAAYVTPDGDPLKSYFVKRVGYNLDWYNANSKKADANVFGFLDSYALDDDGTIAPWMDDFFTWSVGYVFDLGFTDARATRDWKVKYQVGRMTDPGFCWISASVYHMNVADPATQKLYGSWSEAYQATLAANDEADLASLDCGSAEMAAKLMLMPGEMVGYSESAEGYPSNLQPALAIAAEADIPNAKKAWATFTARPVKPDYASEPQFAIVPR